MAKLSDICLKFGFFCADINIENLVMHNVLRFIGSIDVRYNMDFFPSLFCKIEVLYHPKLCYFCPKYEYIPPTSGVA